MEPLVYYFERNQEDFVRTRRAAAARYHDGTGSPVLAMIALLAACTRRSAGAIERWAKAPADGTTPGLHRATFN